MHFSEKNKSILNAIVVGLSITPGLVICGWGFQILSFSRLARTSLYILIFPVIAALIFNHYFQIKFPNPNRKQIFLNLLVSFAFSIIVAGHRSDLLHYFATVLLSSITFFFIGLAFVTLTERWKRNILQQSYMIFLLFIGIIGVSIYFYMSIFVRLYGDDFCITNWVRTDGFWNTIIFFYNNWSGRFFTTLFNFGFSSTTFQPFANILLLIVDIYFVLHWIRYDSTKRFSLWAASNALFLSFVIFSTLPDPYKSIYWRANAEGIFPVSLMFILFTGFMMLGFLKGFKHIWLSTFAAFFMAMAISNAHEITVPAIFLLIMVFLFYSIFNRKLFGTSTIIIMLSALIGAIAGSLILILAPGNYVRMAQKGYPPIPDLITAIRLSLGFFMNFLGSIANNWHWALLIASFLAGIYANTILHKSWKSLALIFFVTLGSTWGTFLVSSFATSQTLPSRTQLIPLLFLVLGLFYMGTVFPIRKINAEITIAFAAIFLSLGFVFTQVLTTETKLVAPIVQFAKDWDFRDHQVRVLKFEPYVITIPWDFAEQQLSCMKKYYYEY